MFIKVDSKTKTEDLVVAGALVDGKITQQLAFLKSGVKIPVTYFFTSDLYSKISSDIAAKSFLDKYLNKIPNYECYEYQIRTEQVGNPGAAKVFSETRTGLSYQDLCANFFEVLELTRSKNYFVGILQILPPDSLSRSLFGGSAQLINSSNACPVPQNPRRQAGEYSYLMIELVLGMATYMARLGSVDIRIKVPLGSDSEDSRAISKIDSRTKAIGAQESVSLRPNYEVHIKYESIESVLETLRISLLRYAIKYLQKEKDSLGISELKLPYNQTVSRYKREYEYNEEDLCAKVSTLFPPQVFQEIHSKISNNNFVSQVADLYSIRTDEEVNLKEFLTLVGANVISQKDGLIGVKEHLCNIIKDSHVNIDKALIDLLVDNILKLDTALLKTHLPSFSCVYNEVTKKYEYIFWDMHLDKELQIEDKKTPDDLIWVRSVGDDFSNLNSDYVGINLRVNKSVNEDLLQVLDILKKKTKVTTIFTKYSLLSHLSTIMREKGFNVISI